MFLLGLPALIPLPLVLMLDVSMGSSVGRLIVASASA